MARIQRLVSIVSIIVAVVALYQLSLVTYQNYKSNLGRNNKMMVIFDSATHLNNSKLASGHFMHGRAHYENASVHMTDTTMNGSEVIWDEKYYDFLLVDDGETESFETKKERKSSTNIKSEWGFILNKNLTIVNESGIDNSSTRANSTEVEIEFSGKFKKSEMLSTQDSSQKSANMSYVVNHKQDVEAESSHIDAAEYVVTSNLSVVANNPKTMVMAVKTTSVSYTNLLSLWTSVSTYMVRPQRPSSRDRELQRARLQIENAHLKGNDPGLHVSLFRNVSMFKRSYEMMERVLKVYIYNEGEKPIFHQPFLKGIYASEGWFMKLMERNKHFVVRDPKKAHLFYLPFSSLMLRRALYGEKFSSHRDLEKHLENYVRMIAKKYRFWNRTSGADHFLVACHDWAPGFTRTTTGTCIRALCNTNIARGFKIGKDVSLPVTYIRSAQDPQKELGGNPPSGRPILAFFAGGMHGYLRPILLKYWNDKEPDMKIFGPMPRDDEGKARYRELMKSSKYCICARGYEVHTPRVVESIHYECVPVIISDNYVPPFYEVFNWDAFAVFVPEKDVPNLRNILLSIPEDKYLDMQRNVKMVQQHFLWHEKPLKYDLFHMILHSVWFNRVFQLNSG